MINDQSRQCFEKAFCCGLIKENTNGYHYTVDDGKFYSCTRFGQTIHIYGKREGYFPFHAVLGPDWPIVILVYTLVIGANVLVLGGVYQLGYVVTVIGVSGCLFLLLMYSATACSDPGTIFNKPPAPPPAKAINTQSAVMTQQPAALSVNSVSPVGVSNDSSNNNTDNSVLPGSSKSSGDIESNNINNNSKNSINTSSNNSNSNTTAASGSPSSEPGKEASKWVHNPDGSMVEILSDQIIQELKLPDTIECGQCELRRPYTARHCSYCKYCIDELDHHCPWCGKCIGENNINFFNCFLASLCFQVYFLVGVVIYYIVFAADPKTPSGPHY